MQGPLSDAVLKITTVSVARATDRDKGAARSLLHATFSRDAHPMCNKLLGYGNGHAECHETGASWSARELSDSAYLITVAAAHNRFAREDVISAALLTVHGDRKGRLRQTMGSTNWGSTSRGFIGPKGYMNIQMIGSRPDARGRVHAGTKAVEAAFELAVVLGLTKVLCVGTPETMAFWEKRGLRRAQGHTAKEGVINLWSKEATVLEAQVAEWAGRSPTPSEAAETEAVEVEDEQ